MDSRATRGFVTIATGERHYYEIARNLLRSYRLFSRRLVPFAIICDQENDITSEFDDVILIRNPRRSFLDKLRLPELVPYDETVFIDADCLAYRDLNGLWKFFSNCGDFATLGYAFPEWKHGWFRLEDTGEFRDKVNFSMVFQGGAYFLRKGRLDSFSATCGYILDHYDSFAFPGYPAKSPVDEPVFALACSIHNYLPAASYKDVFGYYPLCGSLKADISKGRLSYRYPPKLFKSPGGYFVHWSTAETSGELYKEETRKLDKMLESGFKPPRRWELRRKMVDLCFACVNGLSAFVKRVLPRDLGAGLYSYLNSKRFKK